MPTFDVIISVIEEHKYTIEAPDWVASREMAFDIFKADNEDQRDCIEISSTERTTKSHA